MMSQPDKISTTVRESPYNPSPIDVEKGLGSTYPASPSSPRTGGRRFVRLGRLSVLRLLLIGLVLFLIVSAAAGGLMAKRHGTADPRKWGVGLGGGDGDPAWEAPVEAYPWECRKGLWSCGLRA